MANYIKKIKAGNGTSAQTYDIFSISADTAISAVTAESAKFATSATTAMSIPGAWVNTSGNFEINSKLCNTSENKPKLNLVSDYAIQLKPGHGKPLQLDCDLKANPENDAFEYSVKTCNAIAKDNIHSAFTQTAGETVALKLTAAEITIDNQEANTNAFDRESIDVKFRYDKWNGGEVSGNTGPVQVKLKGRSFDLRCHDHGGIALQIAGRDSGNHENKIKFESDRITPLGQIVSSASYCKEGGKGMEFGTFNNEHTSLYTGDYRFKGDAKVYGCTRGVLSANTSGKIDYPTQGDDFKDILPTTGATWNEIIDVARKYADGEIAGGGGSAAKNYSAGEYIKIENDVISVTGITPGGAADVSGKVDKEINSNYGKSLIFNESDGGGAKFEHGDGTWSYVGVNNGGADGIAAQLYAVNKDNTSQGTKINIEKDKITYIKNKATSARTADDEIAVKGDLKFINGRVYRKDKNGNLEVTAEGLGKYATDYDPSTEVHPSSAVMYANVAEYNTDKGTSLTEEEFAALTETEKIKTPAVLADPATLDLVSDDKIAMKCKELEIGAPMMSWAIEISKKNKVTLGGNDYYPVSATDEDANKAATYEQMKALFPSLGVNIEKNNSATADIKDIGTGFIGINILDLVGLVSRVASLEARVNALENPQQN